MKLATSPEIKTHFNGLESNLHCPRCDADNLHHVSVSVIGRAEDAQQVVLTEVRGSQVTMESTTNSDSGNPSSRRDGLVIGFVCEQCGDDKIIELCIAQHKGSTELSWRFTPLG